jgi:TRAP-type C4-dicarboxylate transport system substrate-binding protein
MFHRLTVLAGMAGAMLLGAGASAEPTQLKLATFGPPQSYFYVEVLIPWAEAVSRDSNGTIDIKHFGGSVLGNAGNMFDTVMSGAADIGWALQATVPAKFVKSSIIELPFGYESGESGAVAFWRVYSRGLIASDYAETHPFGFTAWPAAAIQTKSKKVQKLEDMKGLKLRVAGKLQADTLLALGAVPLAIPVDEIYTSIEKGVIDGAYASFTATRSFRLQEVARNFLDAPLNGAGAMLVMSAANFAKLPAAAKAAMDKHSGERLSRALGKSNDGEVVRLTKMLEDLSKQGKVQPMYKLSAAELARWTKTVQPVIDGWVSRTPNGKAILEGFRSEVAAAKKGS